MKTCGMCGFYHKRRDVLQEDPVRDMKQISGNVAVLAEPVVLRTTGTCHCELPKVAMNVIPRQGLQGLEPTTLTSTYRPSVESTDLACNKFLRIPSAVAVPVSALDLDKD